jgi:hypothetical protein
MSLRHTTKQSDAQRLSVQVEEDCRHSQSDPRHIGDAREARRFETAQDCTGERSHVSGHRYEVPCKLDRRGGNVHLCITCLPSRPNLQGRWDGGVGFIAGETPFPASRPHRHWHLHVLLPTHLQVQAVHTFPWVHVELAAHPDPASQVQPVLQLELTQGHGPLWAYVMLSGTSPTPRPSSATPSAPRELERNFPMRFMRILLQGLDGVGRNKLNPRSAAIGGSPLMHKSSSVYLRVRS